MKGDSVCCTKVSIVSGVHPLTTTVTPHPDEVHSTCNCKGVYVHQVPL